MTKLLLTHDYEMIENDAEAYSSFFVNINLMTMNKFLVTYSVGIADWSLYRFCEKLNYFNLIRN